MFNWNSNVFNIKMDNNFAKKTCSSLALSKVQELNSSMSEQKTDSAKHGLTSSFKRKASADNNTQHKSTRLSETQLANTSEKDASMRGLKRKVREDGEGPEKEQKGKRSDSNKYDKEVTAEFREKYQQQHELGEGGYGSVFAGYRKTDNLPVAIKHIPKDKVLCKLVDKKRGELSMEVAIMLHLAAKRNGSVGESAPVSLLDWYDLGHELILVLERPVPAMDLFDYLKAKGGSLKEEEAKIIMKQMVDAAIDLQDKQIFHRDIKLENVLIETSSDVPCVRIIDFGLSCFANTGSFFSHFYGTSSHAPLEWHSYHIYTSGPTTVWQLGVLLFEILHSGADFNTIEFVEEELSISDELSEDCQDLLRACLSEETRDRITLEQLRRHPWLG